MVKFTNFGMVEDEMVRVALSRSQKTDFSTVIENSPFPITVQSLSIQYPSNPSHCVHLPNLLSLLHR